MLTTLQATDTLSVYYVFGVVVIIILGLVILVAAVVVGVAGVLSNDGGAHALNHGFAVFGYHVTGSTGTLFLWGIVVGAIAVLGLSLLLASARRASRRGRAARRGLKQSRRETAAVSKNRDELIEEREIAGAEIVPANGSHPGDTLDPDDTPPKVLASSAVPPARQSAGS
jgi:uncharacterized membrane protein YciS (DUF1049 family)